MLAPDGWNVTIEDRAYAQGYRNAEDDTCKRITQKLWERHKLIKKLSPELAEGLELAIDEIEKLNRYTYL